MLQDAFESFVFSSVHFFTFLFREELNEQLELKRKEKKKMRKILKKFEDDFFEETGRYVMYELPQYSYDIQSFYRQKVLYGVRANSLLRNAFATFSVFCTKRKALDSIVPQSN